MLIQGIFMDLQLGRKKAPPNWRVIRLYSLALETIAEFLGFQEKTMSNMEDTLGLGQSFMINSLVTWTFVRWVGWSTELEGVENWCQLTTC